MWSATDAHPDIQVPLSGKRVCIRLTSEIMDSSAFDAGGGRVAEGGGLISRRARKSLVGSNPIPPAIQRAQTFSTAIL